MGPHQRHCMPLMGSHRISLAPWSTGGSNCFDNEQINSQRSYLRTSFSKTIKSAKGRNRTADTSIFSAVLYRLSYLGMCVPVWYVPHYSMSLLRRQYLLLSNYHPLSSPFLLCISLFQAVS